MIRVLKGVLKGIGRRMRRLLEWLGILKRRPISVKPTGTISKIYGVSEGIHPTYGPYHTRRVRIGVGLDGPPPPPEK